MKGTTKTTQQKAGYTSAYAEETNGLEILTDFEGNLTTSPVNVILTQAAPIFEFHIFMPLGKRIIIFEQDFIIKGVGRIIRKVKIRNTGIDLTLPKQKIYTRNVCCAFDWLDEGIQPDNPEKLISAGGAEIIDGVFAFVQISNDDGAAIASEQIVEIGEEGASPILAESSEFVLDIKAPFIIGGEPRLVGTAPDDKQGTLLSIRFELQTIGGGAPIAQNEAAGLFNAATGVYDSNMFIEDPENAGQYIYNPESRRVIIRKSGNYR